MGPRVSIVIVNYNGLQFLENCLSSVKNQTHKNIETIVVDNRSTDGSIDYLKTIPWIKLIVNEVGLGYAGGNNVGAEAATGEYLLILTNDTTVPKDFVKTLLECYEEKSLISPCQVLMNEPDSEGFAGNGMDILGYPYGGESHKNTKVFYADGAAIFLKTKDFMDIGMFDGPLFLFQEDVDLSWRAQLMGYKIIPCTKAKFNHYSGGTLVGGAIKKGGRHKTSYLRRYHVERNTLRNILKNYSVPVMIPILFLFFTLNLVQVFLFLILGKFKLVKCFIDALEWNIKHFGETMERRKAVQEKRQISDFDLMKKMYWRYSKITAFFRVGGLPIFK